MAVTHLQGDCREVLRTLPERSVHCCVTSPPYFGLRDYGIPPSIWGGDPACAHDWSIEKIKTEVSGGNWAQSTNGRGEVQGEPDEFRAINAGTQQRGFCRRCNAWLGVFGLEPTPELYVAHGVEVFQEVRRVLRDDATLWLNVGDSYSAYNGNRGNTPYAGHDSRVGRPPAARGLTVPTLKSKDLMGIPWQLAFALRDDGWYLRSAFPWIKRAAMPESCDDRPSSALEYVFLMTKKPRYYYDSLAVRKDTRALRNSDFWLQSMTPPFGMVGFGEEVIGIDCTSRGYSEAHFATFPPDLIEPCILAGTSDEGCCDQCGAPFTRVVESERVATRPANDTKTTGDSLVDGNRDPERHVTRKTTRGWQQSCKCEGAKPTPCTVLDPFGGSGTTGQVAQNCGCHAILIELNPKYITMQKKRVEQTSLLT